MGDRNTTEAIRELAAVIASDLRVTPNGRTMRELTVDATRGTVRRALDHLRDHGVAVEFDRASKRWKLGDGHRHLPAAGMCREDLLDELRFRLGDGDPLEAIDALRLEQAAGEWRTIEAFPLLVAKRVSGVSWVVSFHHHRLTLSAAPVSNGLAQASRTVTVCTVDDFDVPTAAVKRYADYLIELHGDAVARSFAEHGEAVASW